MLSIETWHGESKTVWYVVWQRPEEPEDWEVLASFDSRWEAELFLGRGA